MGQQRLWFVFDLSRGRLWSCLSTDEVKILVSFVTEAQKKSLLVWKEGWTEWQSVAQAQEIQGGVKRPISTAPPTIQSHYLENKKWESEISVDTVTKSQSSIEVTKDSSIHDFQQRDSARFRRRLAVVIEVNGMSFRTHTKNISVGGALLENPLPDWVVGYCTIKLKRLDSGDEKELTFSVVENQPPDQRVRIQFSNMTDLGLLAELEDWLDAS